MEHSERNSIQNTLADEQPPINCHKLPPSSRREANEASRFGRGRHFRSSRVKHQIGRDLLLHSISVSLLVLLAVQKEFNCLRISSIGIPPAILNGSQTTLECNYELGPGDQLYSVTWYKDRVGFYRYQPTTTETQEQTTTTSSTTGSHFEPAGQNLNLDYQSHHQAATTTPAPANAKHEFDWAGISLDLARSNSTHVHLKQVGLNSEGTYECEVIADAPTFATVSASRQMKVYVLPKRKLLLTDNSQQQQHAAPQVAQSLPSSAHNNDQLQQTHPLFRQNQFYQLNELLNFTCASGASRPAAGLSWFLNDLPIAAFLQPQGPNDRGDSSNKSLEHQQDFRSAWANQTTSKSAESPLAETRSTLVLRLSSAHLRQLRAKASQQQRQRSVGGAGGSYLPLKLSCVAQLSVEFTSNTSLLISGGKASTTTKRSRQQPVETQPEASSWRLDNKGPISGGGGINSRRRPIGELQDGLTDDEGDPETISRDSDRMDQPELVSIFRWPAARQRPTKFTSDYDMASVATPGGLETNYHPDSGELSTMARKPMNGRNLVVWTNRQLRDQSDHIDRLLARSSANELEPAHIEAQTVRGERAKDEDEADPSTNGWPSSRSSTSQTSDGPTLIINNNNKDFELYELVNFTCYQENRAFGLRDGSERMHSVQLKWFLNDQELAGDLVNAYEPTRGFHFEPNESMQSKQVAGERRHDATVARGSHHWRVSGQSDLASSTTSRSLLIEFSPNLFRLKELSLRCKTIIEQPLIEFESVQWLHLATSPFIQAQDSHSHGQQPARPTLFNVNSRHRQQHKQQGNVIRMRHQSSRTSPSSSAGSLVNSSLLVGGPVWMLAWMATTSLLLLLSLQAKPVRLER